MTNVINLDEIRQERERVKSLNYLIGLVQSGEMDLDDFEDLVALELTPPVNDNGESNE